jgi:hypothetical protein
VPQIRSPHSEPVTSAAKVKDAPIGAQLAATAFETLIRQIRPTPAEAAMVVYTMSDIHALGA